MNLTGEWKGESGLGQLARLLKAPKDRSKRLIGWLIAFIITAIIIAAMAAIAMTTLTKDVQTARAVADVLGNSMAEMAMQTSIDQQLLTRLDALEAALVWLGDPQEALNTHLKLHWDWEHQHQGLRVTPLHWNQATCIWEHVKAHLQGAFATNINSKVQDSNP